MSVGELNLISKSYNNGYITQADVSTDVLLANANNIFQGFHEIAQINIAHELYNMGYSPTLELPVGRKEADIYASGMMWEVKPISSLLHHSNAPDKQLQGYLAAKGSAAGFDVFVKDIPIVGDYYMDITADANHPGIEYYYFHKHKCDQQPEYAKSTDVQVDAKTVGTAAVVAAVVWEIVTAIGRSLPYVIPALL